MTDLNTVDLRERIALSKDFSPAERDFILDAVNRSTGTYLVWSIEHTAWWRPGRWGYDRGLHRAGRFVRDVAIGICRDALPTAAHIGIIAEVPVRLDDLEDAMRDRVVPAAVFTGKR